MIDIQHQRTRLRPRGIRRLKRRTSWRISRHSRSASTTRRGPRQGDPTALTDPITLDDAYAIQKQSLARRYRARRAAGRHQDGLHEPREDGPDGRPRHDLGPADRRHADRGRRCDAARALRASAGRARGRVPAQVAPRRQRHADAGAWPRWRRSRPRSRSSTRATRISSSRSTDVVADNSSSSGFVDRAVAQARSRSRESRHRR